MVLFTHVSRPFAYRFTLLIRLCHSKTHNFFISPSSYVSFNVTKASLPFSSIFYAKSEVRRPLKFSFTYIPETLTRKNIYIARQVISHPICVKKKQTNVTFPYMFGYQLYLNYYAIDTIQLSYE